MKDKIDDTVKSVKEKFSFKTGKPAAPVAALAGNASAVPQATEAPQKYVFTPDLKVYGSEEYQNLVNRSLEELKKTPDSFRINGRTAYEYATYWTDNLYEGGEGGVVNIDGKEYSGRVGGYPRGVEVLPKEKISASNLIHIARHFEQGEIMLDKILSIKDYKERAFFAESDAVNLQMDWETARYNYTDDVKRARLEFGLNYYRKIWGINQT